MSMKVGSSSGTKSVGSTKKSSGTSSVSGAGFSSFLGEVDETSSATTVSGTSGVGGIEALLAVQSVGDATQENSRKKRALARGNELLDRLEDLRTAYLSGSISKSDLIELAQLIRQRREEGLDPELQEVMDEIELRAEVELAKLSRNV